MKEVIKQLTIINMLAGEEKTYWLFDEKESGCGFYYKATNKKFAELAFFADFGTKYLSIKEITSPFLCSHDIYRSAQKAINDSDCF